MPALTFTLLKKDDSGSARLGAIETAHGAIETPIFMPCGTRGAVKTLTEKQLHEVGAQIILGNTYHLMLRPGIEVLREAGGLHSFMRWDKPILTDSGGFQVFSLAKLNVASDEGVSFQSHIDGSSLFLGPKESMQMQKVIGSDIVMCFDECAPYPCSDEKLGAAVQRTLLWAKECRDFELRAHQNLFGIVQGGVNPDLRKMCAKKLCALNFEGYAIGGLSVGESAAQMYDVLDTVCPELPEAKPRYLMGVGTPRNIVEAVMRGVDMFDCVMPTRAARGGTAYTWQGKIQIKAGRYAHDFSPLDPELSSYASRFSKAYIRHLLNVNEITGLTLVTMQNLAFYLDFMRQLRLSIREGRLLQFYEKVASLYPV
jgi:queuine tRNA-ribosyltransferase